MHYCCLAGVTALAATRLLNCWLQQHVAKVATFNTAILEVRVR